MTTKQQVIVIGSGIGGLSCAALCARAGLDVLVLEAHGHAGGAAHGFERHGFQFESGPSLWSGLGRWPSSNPLAQILRALDEPLEVIAYREWDVLLPEGHLSIGVGDFRCYQKHSLMVEKDERKKCNLQYLQAFVCKSSHG